MPGRVPAVAAAVTAATLAIAASAVAEPLSLSSFAQLAARCAPTVASSTLASIARTESGFEPLSINDNTSRTSGTPATRGIAVQVASKLLAAGHSLDIGIMQINSANFIGLGLTLEEAFDPCRSVAAGAAILAGDYAGGDTHADQQSALRVALSRYNTGNAQRGFANGYVHKVELAAEHLVPALDVGTGAAATDRQTGVTVPVAPMDPNAPPSWDVWSSFDYEASHQGTAAASPASLVPASLAPTDPGHGAAVLTDAAR